MNKNRILGIGIGQAGNILLNEFLDRDKRYTGLFINSAYDDMSGLSNFNYEKNAFVFPGESGTGKDREKAKLFVKSSLKSLADIFTRYPLHDVIQVFFSTDGGTGSGSAIMILQTLRKVCPNKKINVVAVLPDPDKSEEIALKNCLDCCSELAAIENMVDDIKFVDNSKFDKYDEINRRVLNDIDAAFSIVGKHSIGNIDESDSKRANTAKGYGAILRLEDDEITLVDAIANAKNNSPFAIPGELDCKFLAISVKEDQYEIDGLKQQFKKDDTIVYNTHNNKNNVVVFGGCSAPNDSIKYIQIRLEQLKNGSEAIKRKGLVVDTNLNTKNNKNKVVDDSIKTTYSEDELDSLVDDLENMFG